MTSTNPLIYFNNNRHTAIDPEVAAAMSLLSASSEDPEELREELQVSTRQQIASMLNGTADNIILTGGITESIAAGINAAYRARMHKGNHIITCSTEHLAVLDSCSALKTLGAEISVLSVDREGMIDLSELSQAIRPETVMVCIMAANNETGVIQPLEMIAEICRKNKVIFFSDASQYIGKMRCDVQEIAFDMLAFGSHKMYGPEGIGALYCSPELLTETASTLEQSLNSSLNELTAAQILGFGKACEIFSRDYWEINTHLSKLRNHFEHQLLEDPGLRINGSTRNRLYNTSNIYFPPHKSFLAMRSEFDFATNDSTPSHVLKAMGFSDEENQRSCRISFGKYNKLEEVQQFIDNYFALGR